MFESTSTPQTMGELYGLIEKRKRDLLSQADTAITLYLFQLLSGMINWSLSQKSTELTASLGQMFPALQSGETGEQFLAQYPDLAQVPVEGFLAYIQAETGIDVLSFLTQLQQPLPQMAVPLEVIQDELGIEAAATSLETEPEEQHLNPAPVEDDPEQPPESPDSPDTPPETEATLADIDRWIEVNKTELGPKAVIMSSSKMIKLFRSYQYAQNFIDTHLIEHRLFEIDREMLSGDEKMALHKSGIRANSHLYDLDLCRDILVEAFGRELLVSDKLLAAEAIVFRRVNKVRLISTDATPEKKKKPAGDVEQEAKTARLIDLWLEYGKNTHRVGKKKYISLSHIFQYYAFPDNPDFDIAVRVERVITQLNLEDKIKTAQQLEIENPLQDNRYINIVFARKITAKLLKHNELDLKQLEEANQTILSHFEQIQTAGLGNFEWLSEWLFSPEVVVHIKNDVYTRWSVVAKIISGDFRYKKERLEALILEWERRNPETKVHVKSESQGLSSEMLLPIQLAVFVIRAMSVDPQLGIKNLHD